MEQYLAAVPDQVKRVVLDAEVETFLDDFNRALLDTHWPVSPCVFAHFIIPLSPFCVLLYFQSLRSAKIKQAVVAANTALTGRGVHWYVLYTS
jgi:hypothetical protein